MKDRKERTLTPKLRFPEFKDGSEWEEVPLDSLATRVTARNTDGSVKRVLTNSAERGIVDQKDYFERDIATAGGVDNYFVVERGDYVYNPRKSTSAPVGPISRNNLDAGVMSPLYTVFRFNDDSTDFYAHYFQSASWHDYLRNASSMGARHDRMAISVTAFMRMPVPRSDPAEQRKIAACLTSLDELLAAQGRKLEALRAHKKGLLQQLFPRQGESRPRLRFPEFRDSGEWQRTQLSDLLFETKRRNRDLAYGPDAVLSVSGEYGCVNQIELLGRSYAGASLKEYKVVEPNNVVYTKSPLKKNPFGIIKANEGKVGIVSTLYAVYGVKASCHAPFIDYYFGDDSRLNSYLEPLVRKGPKNDMKVNNEVVLTGKIDVPRLDEQQRIAACLASLDGLIAAASRKLHALRAHKKGLVQQLFPSPVGV